MCWVAKKKKKRKKQQNQPKQKKGIHRHLLELKRRTRNELPLTVTRLSSSHKCVKTFSFYSGAYQRSTHFTWFCINLQSQWAHWNTINNTHTTTNKNRSNHIGQCVIAVVRTTPATPATKNSKRKHKIFYDRKNQRTFQRNKIHFAFASPALSSFYTHTLFNLSLRSHRRSPSALRH